MPIKATPFQHQRDAFDFACGLFGLTEQSDKRSPETNQMCDGVLQIKVKPFFEESENILLARKRV